MSKRKNDMGQYFVAGNPSFTVYLRRSGRARRISLRVSGLDGRVTLTLPPRVAESQGLAFVDEKADWLRRQIAARPEMLQVGLGTVIPIGGVDHDIVAGQGRRIQMSDGQIMVPGPVDTAGRRLNGYLKGLARDQLALASDHYAARLGLPYNRLTLRDTRSRWGSCTADGGLMYSWRLIMAPSDVLDYVAAHEVAHLKHMDHSPAFWDQVEALYGDYHDARSWLREHGSALHRYRFGN